MDIWKIASRAVRDRGPLLALRQRLYDRKFAHTRAWKNLTRGVYRSFAEARQAAPTTMPATYEIDDEAFAHRVAIESHDYPALFWLRPALERGATVLDFGGHVGVQYYLYARYVDVPPALRWVVCDLPHVVALGRRLAAEREARHLSFVDDLAKAERADIFFTAGCIQFVEEPLHAVLRRARWRPRAVLVNKLPLYDEETRVTVQNTGRSFTPCWLFNADELVGSIERLGYRLVDRWRCPERSVRIPFHPEHCLPALSGLYFEATSQPAAVLARR